jgi:hypothetical protein
MKKALELTNQEFESSTGRTPEYLSWHRTFKKEFTKFLTEKGCTRIEIRKPNHFDMSGFFTLSTSNVITIWYFSISDVRWSKENMLIRTANSYQDYTGGRNQYISLVDNEMSFKFDFTQIVEKYN